MESSTRPHERERFVRAGDRPRSDLRAATTAEEATTEIGPGPSRAAEIAAPLISGAVGVADPCRECGARLAADQRYCVECGARRGDTGPPFGASAGARPPDAVAAAPSARRPRVSLNATLIAAIGTLLLAMGVGVLIGRSGNSSTASSKAPPVQVVTVPAAGAATGTAGAAAPEPTTTSAPPTAGPGGSSAPAAKPSGQRAGAARGSASPAPKRAAAAPPPNTVTVGSKGSGPGYQHGKFTGNFFGG